MIARTSARLGSMGLERPAAGLAALVALGIWWPSIVPPSRPDPVLPRERLALVDLTLPDLAEKPLFNPARRRPPPAAAESTAPPPPAPRFVDLHHVSGTARSGADLIVFVTHREQSVTHPLRRGDVLQDHVLSEVTTTDVVFTAPDGTSVSLSRQQR